ncbi:uncharacterized protein N7506_010622 [Penicillium brevicompactum]|uniref:uncharacterized protein n=1 Tax=Penicillium brevicompactum TaxID=5074 RepID=UPI00253F75BC|nr:uncharacterized protein N7506_010622 [Penicillium brevicompactum]KAJ5327520.1 hypothetical protein N7506_010622 [Penicillium brevicompactum]
MAFFFLLRQMGSDETPRDLLFSSGGEFALAGNAAEPRHSLLLLHPIIAICCFCLLKPPLSLCLPIPNHSSSIDYDPSILLYAVRPSATRYPVLTASSSISPRPPESVCAGFVGPKAFLEAYNTGDTRGLGFEQIPASQERGGFENRARSRAAVLITGVAPGALLKRLSIVTPTGRSVTFFPLSTPSASLTLAASNQRPNTRLSFLPTFLHHLRQLPALWHSQWR